MSAFSIRKLADFFFAKAFSVIIADKKLVDWLDASCFERKFPARDFPRIFLVRHFFESFGGILAIFFMNGLQETNRDVWNAPFFFSRGNTSKPAPRYFS